MIRKSFIFLPKVGRVGEKNIWSQGIDSWDDFLKEKKVFGISQYRKPHFDRIISTAGKCLYSQNSEFFTNILPVSEQWRLYNFFKEDACFLDIETTGYYGDTTVLGVFDGCNTKTFVKGQNLYRDLISEELSKYKLLVTFNGASFDLPVIKRQFNLDFKIPHVDLRFVCKKIGLCGGLKKIEKDLGIKRAEEVEGISGEDAVVLWHKYKTTGDEKSLKLLVQYNEEDIINLKQLADFSVPKLWAKTRSVDNNL